MCKKVLKLSVIIASVAILLSSCSKDDDNNPSSSNPTNGKTTAVFNSTVTYGTMSDQDGNVYKTVTIGTQTWMAENLRTTKYNDGTAIPLVTDNTAWNNLSTGAYCNYNNTSNSDTIGTFGRLYNWYAVNTDKLAPTSWHVPTHAEWTTLTTYIGRSALGGKLKETGITHWNNPSTASTNETGFTALPGGYRNDYDNFQNIGKRGCWWTATENYASYAFGRYMYDDNSSVGNSFSNKEFGLSVRCVRD